MHVSLAYPLQNAMYREQSATVDSIPMQLTAVSLDVWLPKNFTEAAPIKDQIQYKNLVSIS